MPFNHFINCTTLISRNQIPEAIVSLLQDLNAMGIPSISLEELLVRLVQNGYKLYEGESLERIISDWGLDGRQFKSVELLEDALEASQPIGVDVEELEDSSLLISISSGHSANEWSEFSFNLNQFKSKESMPCFTFK